MRWKGKLLIRIAESYKSTASLQRMKPVSQVRKVATWLAVIAPKLSEKEKEISQQNVDPLDIACDNRNFQQLNFCLSFYRILKSGSFLVVGMYLLLSQSLQQLLEVGLLSFPRNEFTLIHKTFSLPVLAFLK